jgi:hypothetical protein
MKDLISEDVWPQFYCAFECRKQQCPCADPFELVCKPEPAPAVLVNSKVSVS